MKIECKNPEEVTRRAFYLAWQACGGTFGMGFLKNAPGSSEADVWRNVQTRGDYTPQEPKPGEAYGDYVFGRMMKLSVRWDETGVSVPDSEPRGDYQAWCGKYPSYKALIEAAIESLSA